MQYIVLCTDYRSSKHARMLNDEQDRDSSTAWLAWPILGTLYSSTAILIRAQLPQHRTKVDVDGAGICHGATTKAHFAGLHASLQNTSMMCATCPISLCDFKFSSSHQIYSIMKCSTGSSIPASSYFCMVCSRLYLCDERFRGLPSAKPPRCTTSNYGSRLL